MTKADWTNSADMQLLQLRAWRFFFTAGRIKHGKWELRLSYWDIDGDATR